MLPAKIATLLAVTAIRSADTGCLLHGKIIVFLLLLKFDFGGWAHKLERVIFHTMLKLVSGRSEIKCNLWLPITTLCNNFRA